MGLYLAGATAPDGTFTNKSSTYTFSSNLQDFSYFFLFMMYASSFPMNRSFPAWMMLRVEAFLCLRPAMCSCVQIDNEF